MAISHRGATTKLWWLWVIATSAGFSLGVFVSTATPLLNLFGSWFRLNYFALLGLVPVGMMALFQSLILSYWLRQRRWWLWPLASIVGWLAYSVLTYFGAYLFPYVRLGADLQSLLLRGDVYLGATIGFMVGFGQWLLLRRSLTESSWWIPINTVAFPVGLSLTASTGFATMLTLRDPLVGPLTNQFVLLGEVSAVGGLIVGAINGVGLLWLLRRPIENTVIPTAETQL